MDHKQMTASWAFWDLEAPTKADIEDSQIPSRDAPDSPKGAAGSTALEAEAKRLTEDNENLSAEIWELKSSIEFLTQVITGK